MSFQLQTVNSQPRTRESTENAPFFSIIIPVYNVAQYLKECLDSVLAQTFGDWECICVDDGSTDGSGEMLDVYARGDSRFRVFHQTNKGVSAARNLALEHAMGDVVCFADGDDITYPWWLSTFYELLQVEEADLVRVQYPSCRSYCLQPPPVGACARCVMTHEKAILEWGWSTFSREGYSCLYAVRRRCVGETRFVNGVQLKEDNLFALALLPKITRAVQCEVVTYWYRFRATSAVHQTPSPEAIRQWVQHYIALVDAQTQRCAHYAANILPATSRVVLRECMMFLHAHAISYLPTLLSYCREHHAFTAEVFPWYWRILLRCCERGMLWPLRLGFLWVSSKATVVRWWHARLQSHASRTLPLAKPLRQFQLFVEPTEYILDLIAAVHEPRGITCAFAYDRKTLASQGTTAFPVVERFSWWKRVVYFWRTLKHYDVVSIHSYSDPISITLLVLNLFWRRQVRFEVDSAWREPHQWLARVAKRMWLGFWFTRPYVWGTSIGAQVHRDFFLKYGLPEARLSERPNVVNNARTARPQPSEPTAAFRFGYVGRLVRHKAVDVLIEAFREVVRRYPQASLTIVGDGPERDPLRIQAADLPQVIFTGALYGREKVVRQHQMDALCLVSLYEPWGLVVNEALAAGTPCIVSACCGCAEPLIRGPQAGVVVPDGDVAALIDAMVYLIEHPTEASTMGQRGAAFLSHEWNYARYARALDEDNEAASRWWRQSRSC